jgi:hypothetical protein
MHKKKEYIIASIVGIMVILSLQTILVGNSQYKWKKISGKWQVMKLNTGGVLYNPKPKAYKFGYSELINNNSIISYHPLKKVTKISFYWKAYNPQAENNVMFFFNAASFKQFHGFRLTGNASQLTKIVLLRSEIKDTTRRRSARWNFSLTELASKKVAIPFSKVYKSTIVIKGSTCAFYLEDEKIFEAEARSNLADGNFGFSHLHNLLQISRVEVFSGNRLIFSDDFSQDSIKRIRFKATPHKVKKKN